MGEPQDPGWITVRDETRQATHVQYREDVVFRSVDDQLQERNLELFADELRMLETSVAGSGSRAMRRSVSIRTASGAAASSVSGSLLYERTSRAHRKDCPRSSTMRSTTRRHCHFPGRSRRAPLCPLSKSANRKRVDLPDVRLSPRHREPMIRPASVSRMVTTTMAGASAIFSARKFEQVERRPVSPMEIFEDHDNRMLAAAEASTSVTPSNSRYAHLRAESPVCPRCVADAGASSGTISYTAGARRASRAPRGRSDAGDGPRSASDHGHSGGIESSSRTSTPTHDRPIGRRSPPRTPVRGGLSDSCLTFEHQHRAVPTARVRERSQQTVHPTSALETPGERERQGGPVPPVPAHHDHR